MSLGQPEMTELQKSNEQVQTCFPCDIIGFCTLQDTVEF